MLKAVSPGSINFRLASVESVSFFFQEVVLDLESPNLFIELGLKGSVLLISALVFARKDLLGPIEQLSLPGADLVRVYGEALSQGGSGLQAFEGFEGDFGFEFGGVLFTFCHGI